MIPEFLLSSFIATLPTHSNPKSAASQVMQLGWEKFHIEAGGAVISGTQGERGLTSLSIKVFRRSFKLTPNQLRELDGFSANGLRTYSEGGWPGQGGETYYLIFFTEAALTERKSKVVMVNEEGQIKIEAGSFR